MLSARHACNEDITCNSIVLISRVRDSELSTCTCIQCMYMYKLYMYMYVYTQNCKLAHIALLEEVMSLIDASSADREKWIRCKYVEKKFVDNLKSSDANAEAKR